jgi:hypothetical protein
MPYFAGFKDSFYQSPVPERNRFYQGSVPECNRCGNRTVFPPLNILNYKLMFGTQTGLSPPKWNRPEPKVELGNEYLAFQ